MPRVLKEFEEVIGRLVSISGHRVLISCGHDEIELLIEEKVLPKLSQLLGQRIAILRLEDRYHIRLLRERTSTSETLNNSSDELPILKHFRVSKCCDVGRLSGNLEVFHLADKNLRGVSDA